MMKKIRKISLLLVAMLAVTMLGGCGSFDASGYIKALLDNSYKNDSAAFVEQKVGTEEQAKELYDLGIETEVNSLIAGVNIADELKNEFTTVLQDVYKSVKYTVGESTKQDDKSYVVEVKYQKMKVFAAAMEQFQTEQQAYTDELSEQVQNGGEYPSEDEINEQVYTLLKDAIKDSLQKAEYEDEASTTVRVELNDKVYSPNQEDVEALEYALFDLEEASGLAL